MVEFLHFCQEEEERELSIVLLQQIIRGRAIQNKVSSHNRITRYYYK